MNEKKSNIAILTDFGFDDIYVGLMKSVIWNIIPECNIVDLAHAIESFNIKQAAFIISKVYMYFPPNTVFLCVVDPGVGTSRKPIVLKSEDRYFVGPDNGIFSYLFDKIDFDKIIELTNTKYYLDNKSNTFQGRDIFAPIAAFVSKGNNINDFGNELDINYLKRADEPKFEIEFLSDNELSITGESLYFDKYGNLISSIEYSRIENLKLNKIIIGNYEANDIKSCYSDVDLGEFLCYVGSLGNLEFGLRNSNLQKSLNENYDNCVKLYFTK
jgi:S-adenosyl-L-methionine hydrolase (adenosine-forming)